MDAGWSADDHVYMAMALEEARSAARAGEVPVGAILVRDGHVLAAAHNLRETGGDPTAHAKMLTIRRAAAQVAGWRLDGAVIYVTLEPCPMCAGALWLARVARLVYATVDEKAGAAGTLYNIVADPRLNHRLRVDVGLMAEESGALLRSFFAQLRSKPKRDGRAIRPALDVRGGEPPEGCPSG